jgi:hypothetical protein
MWLDSSTVTPSCWRSCTHCWNTCSINGSSPEEGSSSTSRSGPRGQRGYQGDLLPVALGIVADPLRRIQLEAFDQLCTALLVDAAVRRADHVEALASGQARPEGDVAGDVREAPV